MLFNSYVFVCCFLPLVLAGFHLAGRHGGPRLAIAWLVLGSLGFYAWWRIEYLALLVLSMGVNFAVGSLPGPSHRLRARGSPPLLTFGIVFNLGLLGYFKYANFMVDTAETLGGVEFGFEKVFLPLAISFFTFQQIAYLVDSHRGRTLDYGPLDYALFVSFFPQLIAGPIVHHDTVIPQFRRGSSGLRADNLAIGGTMFAIGLFKKVVIADTLMRSSVPVFAHVHAVNHDPVAIAAGLDPATMLEAWGGALAWVLQLYFDFSGYSDMALGLARMFGVKLPLNFFSPLKSRSMIEMWRRWHITLSAFLRDYCYIPLGGSRCGPVRRYFNLFLTMTLGGLWHGAAWTYVCWGMLHGAFLLINHAWRALPFAKAWRGRRRWAITALLITFVAWTMSLVLFRSESFADFASMSASMVGLNGISLSNKLEGSLGFLAGWGVAFDDTGSFPSHGFGHIAIGLAIAWLLPNTAQLMRHFDPASEPVKEASRLSWRPNWRWALFTAILLGWSVANLDRVSEFLYFQF